MLTKAALFDQKYIKYKLLTLISFQTHKTFINLHK